MIVNVNCFVCPTFCATEHYHRGGDHRRGSGVPTAMEQQQHNNDEPELGTDLEPCGAEQKQHQHQHSNDEPVLGIDLEPCGANGQQQYHS